ncbi:MAG: TonB-dependent receptor, partial [Acidobacteriota bacterium]
MATNLYQVLRWLYWGAYVQDNWKVTPRFTLNLGVRFNYFGHWGNYHNSTTPFPWFTPGSGSTFAQQVADGTMSVRGGQAAYVTNNRVTGIGPRIGFGWDMFGNGKTALRGGYGIYYNNVADGSYSFNARTNPPTWATPSFGIFDNQPFSYGLGDSTGSIWPVPPGLTYQVNSAGGLVCLPVFTS